jgi:hypothetical protein
MDLRSACVAAQGKYRVSNPEVQAQNALMRKWDLTSQGNPHAEVLQAYNEVFHSPLGSVQRKAIRALFTASSSHVVVGSPTA